MKKASTMVTTRCPARILILYLVMGQTGLIAFVVVSPTQHIVWMPVGGDDGISKQRRAMEQVRVQHGFRDDVGMVTEGYVLGQGRQTHDVEPCSDVSSRIGTRSDGKTVCVSSTSTGKRILESNGRDSERLASRSDDSVFRN